MENKIEVEMEYEKDTKRTFRFTEGKEHLEAVIGTLYVKKAAFGNKTPSKIKVTVEVLK